MAKRKRSATLAMTMPHEPPPEQRRKWAAESMARTMMETDPGMERLHREMAQEMLAAGKRVMSGRKPFVRGGRRRKA